MGEREISFLPHVRVIWTRIICLPFLGPPALRPVSPLSEPNTELLTIILLRHLWSVAFASLPHWVSYRLRAVLPFRRSPSRGAQISIFFSLISLTRAKDFAEKEGLLEVQVTHDLGSARSLSPGVKVQAMKHHTTTLFHKRNSSKEERKEEKTKRRPRVGGTSLIGTLWEGSQSV